VAGTECTLDGLVAAPRWIGIERTSKAKAVSSHRTPGASRISSALEIRNRWPNCTGLVVAFGHATLMLDCQTG